MILRWFQSIITVSLVILLSGCVQLRFSQVEKVSQWLEQPSSETIYHPYLWDISIGHYQTSMLQVDLTEKIGFTNKEQEAIVFADNRIIALGPLGPYSELIKIKHIQHSQPPQTQPLSTQLYHSESNGVLLAVEKCTAWQSVNTRKLVQTCTAKTSYINTIHLDERGNIVEVNQFLPVYNQYIVLQKRAVLVPS